MALSYHGNLYVVMATKKCTLAGQSGRKSVLKRCHRVVICDLGDVWWHYDVTPALTDVMVQEIDIRVPGDVT